ncbi:MAG TPA: GGDEF domain-containing protein [Polyangiales bacterium]|nr:GGDEF domain-containing protein [Polyangiales bacterium]
MTATESTDALSRDELLQLSLFAAADLEVLEPVLRGCLVRSLAPGTVLIAAGSDNRCLFLVLSGALGVHLQAPDSAPIALLRSGETAGEISLIDREPASAFLIAHEPSRVLVLDEDLLWMLARSSHAVAYNLLRTLAGRLRAGNERLQQDRERIEHYKFQASVDSLTGVFNRHWMDEMLARLMERSRVSGAPLALLMIDIDHFKEFNDRHGHVAGDYALRTVASCLRSALRPTDLLARYGGEEFVVLLPGAALVQAREVGERLRAAARAARIVHPSGTALPSVTISIGAAPRPPTGTAEDFLDAADKALYRAKHAGRDRVAD